MKIENGISSPCSDVSLHKASIFWDKKFINAYFLGQQVYKYLFRKTSQHLGFTDKFINFTFNSGGGANI